MANVQPPTHGVSDEGGSQVAWRLRVYPIAIVVTLFAAVVLGAISAGNSDAPADAVGGDYGAFYGAGKLAAEGEWEGLYELDNQIRVQADFVEDSEGDVARFFGYPPQVALVYQPLAALTYHWSYLLHTFAMAGFLLLAIWLARPMIPWLSGHVGLGFAAALLFWPMFRAVTGGSNTAFTLFLIVAGWRLVHDDHEWVAGVVLAGLFFKPQFAIPLIGLFLLGRYWRVVAGALAGGIVFYIWGVTLQGWNWAFDWLEVASDFGTLDAEINGHSSISLIGFAENLFGVGMSGPVLLAWILAFLTALLLSWLWWRGDRVDLLFLLAIAMPGIPLLSLHAMSHDGAVVVLSAAVAVATWERRAWLPWVTVVWLLGASQIMIRQLGFSPGFPMLLIVLIWAGLVMKERPSGAAIPEGPRSRVAP